MWGALGPGFIRSSPPPAAGMHPQNLVPNPCIIAADVPATHEHGMSFFILHRDAFPSEAVQRCCDTLRAHFPPPLRRRAGDLQLLLFGNQSGEEPALFEADGGDFIAALGSLIYDGEPAPACLPRLLTAFEPDAFDWGGLLGTHVVLIRKSGRLHLFADGLGASRIYADEDGRIWSNSFLALCEATRPSCFDVQACYEYVSAGAVYGSRTLVQGIHGLPANSLLQLDASGTASIRQQPSPIRNDDTVAHATLDTVAAQHCRQLDCVFEPIARHYGDRIRLSFSGGFDSRLMLAMLLRHGARPSLFVYGDDTDEDVRIARLICDAEGLALRCIDKGQVPPLPLDAFAEETEKNLYAFDGWKVESGLFDHGADRLDRLSRHEDGHVPLNGSLGEIYRNFFYMPDGPTSTAAVLSTFYARYDPRAFTARFDERHYRAAMAAAMREAIGADSESLQRWQVEALYPNFRGRFWTGRDAQNNQRFGTMFFPYLEPAAIANTARVPLRFKDLGRLQGRMIAHVNPRLADYPSDYGFALNGPRPWKYRLKTMLSTRRPPLLRQRSFRLTHRRPEARSGPLAPDYLGRVIDLDFPVMRALFHIDRVNSVTQYGLIATLEYLGERYGLRVPAS